MTEKLNKDVLGLPGVEDLIELYGRLTPWEQAEVSELIGYDFYDFSEEEILKEFGINPIDHVDAKDIRDAFGSEAFEEYYDYEILEEVEERLYHLDAGDIIDLLSKKADEGGRYGHDFTDGDIERLEEILETLKEKKNNQVKK